LTSFRLIGPISPPLAFDGESDTSAASLSKASPPVVTRTRSSSIRAWAASSAATLIPRPSPGTATWISRSVTDGAVVNSFMCVW
jgi:hypothetical protein